MRKSGNPTPESLVLKACIQWLYHKKIFHFRMNTGAYKSEKGTYIRYGFPGAGDIFVLINGVTIFIECKAGKNDLTESQVSFKYKIEAHGGVYIVARSTGDLERELALYLTPRPF